MSAEEDFQAELRSLRIYNGNVTRTYKELTKLAVFLRDNPGPQGETQLIKALQAFEGARQKSDTLCLEMFEKATYSPFLTDSISKDINSYLDDTTKMAATADQAVLTAMQALKPHPPPVAAPAPAIPAQGRQKPVDALRPSFKLRPESSPNDVTMWKKTFLAYAHASAFEQYTETEQHMFLFSCVSVELAIKLQGHDNYRDNLPLSGDDSLMTILDELFAAEFPLFNRRLAYFRLRQAAGQCFSDFYSNLKQYGESASIQALSREDIEIFRILTGVTDQTLRERFFLIENPTLAKIKAEAQRYEALTRAEEALSKNQAKARGVGSASQDRISKKQGHGSGTQQIPASLRNKCFRCASCKHVARDCPRDPNSLFCKWCNRSGHVEDVCFKKHISKNKSRTVSPTNTEEDNYSDEDDDNTSEDSDHAAFAASCYARTSNKHSIF
jgi:hypothetical protein